MSADEKKKSEDRRCARKPYQQPIVIESASFETLALSCNKIESFLPGFCTDPFGATPPQAS